jgi:hypothetical protein
VGHGRIGVLDCVSGARLGREIETLVGEEDKRCGDQSNAQNRKHLAKGLHTDDDPVEFQTSRHACRTSSITVT